MTDRKGWWKIALLFVLYFAVPYAFQFLLIWAAPACKGIRALLSCDEEVLHILLNLLNDSVALLACILLLFEPIKREITAFRQEKREERRKKLGLLFPYGVILLILNATGFLLIETGFHIESANQATIETMLLSGHSWVTAAMIVLAVFFGPIIEEIIFRFGFYGLLRKKSKALGYIISAFLFGLAHVLSALIVDGEWLQLLEVIPYGLMGVGLARYYERCGNICYSIFLHMAFNVFGVMSTLIG